MQPNVHELRNLAQPDLYLRITQMESAFPESELDEQDGNLAMSATTPDDDEYFDVADFAFDLESLRLRAIW